MQVSIKRVTRGIQEILLGYYSKQNKPKPDQSCVNSE